MSIFSGKCDLYDHIMGQGGWYDKSGHPVKFGDKDVSVYCSDEYRDFLAFKKKTGGVLHQHKEIKVDEYNQDLVAELCDGFEIVKVITQTKDKRTKNGIREDVSYTYKYYGKEYTLKELNKHGVFITIDIHFKTMLDLIPYYPYIVTSCCSHDGKETVYISDESFVISERDRALQYGYKSLMWEYYAKVLQDHYRDIVLRYFDPMNREEVEFVEFDENRQAVLNNPIDENFDVEWFFEDGQKRPHWTSPIVVDADKGIIEISEEDYNNYLGKSADVYYVKKVEFGVYLG